MRGASIEDDGKGNLMPGALAVDTEQVLDDVSEWLGFKGVWADYLLALPKERERIFQRATY